MDHAMSKRHWLMRYFFNFCNILIFLISILNVRGRRPVRPHFHTLLIGTTVT